MLDICICERISRIRRCVKAWLWAAVLVMTAACMHVCEGGLSLRLIPTSPPEWNADLAIRMKDIITDPPSDPSALSTSFNWMSLYAGHSHLPPAFLDWVLLGHRCRLAGITLSSCYPKSRLHYGKGQGEEWGHCSVGLKNDCWTKEWNHGVFIFPLQIK